MNSELIVDMSIQPAKSPTNYPHPCCNVPENMIRLDAECRDDLEVIQCQVCKCRQREFIAKRGNLKSLFKTAEGRKS